MKKLSLLKWTTAILVASAATGVAQVAINRGMVREWSRNPLSALPENQVKIQDGGFNASSNVRENRLIGNVVEPTIPYNEVVDDGTRVRFMVSSGTNKYDSGVGGIRPTAGAPIDSYKEGNSYGSAVYAEGKVYASNYFRGHGQVLKAEFIVYNLNTGEVEKEITLEEDPSRIFDTGAYNPADGKIYVLGYRTDNAAFFSELNPETGIYSNLVHCPVKVRSMAFDAAGQLYILTVDGNLETVNLVNGNRTVVMKVDDEEISYYSPGPIAFDYHTGNLYWIRKDSHQNTDLRRIDIENKSVEILSGLDDIGASLMWVDSPSAPDTAPNTIAALTADQSKGMSNATISLTAPVTTFSGGSLAGEVNVTLTVDGDRIGEYRMQPGESKSVSGCDLKARGNHKIAAVVANSAGKSPEGSITVFSGIDYPRQVLNPMLEVTDDGFATISWDAPDGGVNNGYIDPEKLTYDVVRWPDGVKVVTGTKSTSFSEQLPGTLTRYHYEITSYCDGNKGETGVTPSVVSGDPLKLPFDRELGGEDWFNLCTVSDLDGNGCTWYELYGTSACYLHLGEPGFVADDWMILPPVYLEAGNYYLETEVTNDHTDIDLDFTYGPSLNISSQKTIKTFEAPLETGDHKAQEYVTIDKPGKYYFGYHYYTTSTNGSSLHYVTVNRLKIENGPSPKSPEAVDGLTGTPFAKGEPGATLSFKAPVKTFDGSQVTALDRIEICDSEDNVIGTVEAPVPGNKYEYVVGNASQGFNTYRLYAVNGEGRGKLNEITIYVGKDIPDMIPSLSYNVENNRVITFEWGAPGEIGINGGYVDPKELTYDFCRSEYETEEPFAVDGATGLKKRSFTWTECQPGTTFGTEQHVYLYGIIPHSSVGEGPLGYISVILGDPKQTPFSESFANCEVSSEVWGEQVVNGEAGLSMVYSASEHGIEPVDNDGGMLLFSPASLSQHAIITPIVELKDMKSPVIMFNMYHPENADENAYLSVQASDRDKTFEPIKQILAKGSSKVSGWIEHKISLDKYNGSDRLTFALIAVGTGPASTFAIDNLCICDDVAHDIEIKNIEGPASLDLGESGDFLITLQSKGLQVIPEYGIDIYADGCYVTTVKGNDLAPHATLKLPVKVAPNATNAGKRITYEARVNLENDENDANDSATCVVNVNGSSLPAPRDFKASENGDTMTLTWTAPSAPVKEEVTETFENATSFSIIAENYWKWVDGDKLVPYGIRDLNYPNNDQPRAFMIWEPKALADFPDKKSWMPHGGNKCLIAFASSFLASDGSFDFEMKTDKWLISPHVAGRTELSFYASSTDNSSIESFEVLVSYGSRDPKDFTLLGETVVLTSPGWNKYTYTLPADAAYFAIHYITNGNDGFTTMFDDISYTAGYDEVEFLGYNLYVNGTAVNSDPIQEQRYVIDYDPETLISAGVSAIYYEGESEAVGETFAAGVASPEADAIDVKGGNGTISITGAEGILIAVYDTLGNQVSRTEGTDGTTVIKLDGGIYVVKAGRTAFKVLVR